MNSLPFLRPQPRQPGPRSNGEQPDGNPRSTISNHQSSIGYVVGGGLKESFRVRLTVDPLSVQEGLRRHRERPDPLLRPGHDMQLGATDPRFADEQSERRFTPVIAKALHGQTLFTNLEILPALMLERGPEPGSPEYADWPAPTPTSRRSHQGQDRPRTSFPRAPCLGGDIAEISAGR